MTRHVIPFHGIDAPDRSVCQYTGELADGLSFPALVPDTNRAAFARAVGFYDCPCGSAFEFSEGMGLEDYAALNRWLGRHVGVCGVDKKADDEAVELRETVEKLRREIDDLTSLLKASGAHIACLSTNVAMYQTERDEYRENADEWRDKYDGAQCRMDEMAAEIRELSQRLADAETARDTANARGSL